MQRLDQSILVFWRKLAKIAEIRGHYIDHRWKFSTCFYNIVTSSAATAPSSSTTSSAPTATLYHPTTSGKLCHKLVNRAKMLFGVEIFYLEPILHTTFEFTATTPALWLAM
jgi:hypothetical protein